MENTVTNLFSDKPVKAAHNILGQKPLSPDLLDTEKLWFSGHGGNGLTVGPDDLRGLFQP